MTSRYSNSIGFSLQFGDSLCTSVLKVLLAFASLKSVAIATFFINYADEVAGFSDSKSSDLLSVSQGIFTVGRFFSTFCMQWIEARYILATFVTILIVLSALASGIGGIAGISIYITLFFFERYLCPWPS